MEDELKKLYAENLDWEVEGKFPKLTNAAEFEKVIDLNVKAISAKIPLGRAGEPEEVADDFLYLGSNMASYVTGEILSIDRASKV